MLHLEKKLQFLFFLSPPSFVTLKSFMGLGYSPLQKGKDTKKCNLCKEGEVNYV